MDVVDVASQTPAPDEEPRDDPNFSASDADVCIVSSDGIRFKVHSTNLRSASSIFPTPPPTSQSDDAVHLDEPARVLRILLAYIYPDPPHPELEDAEFDLLYDVAIAADKYQFMMLVYICEFALEKHSATNAFKILRYAELRGNKRVMDRVARDTLMFGLSTGIQELQGDRELFSRWVCVHLCFLLVLSSSYSRNSIHQIADRFDSSILFSATKDIDSWLQTLWGKRI
ncbi:hypothetical protein BDZ89DRAFT_1079555 [Hymenopellis radicata]|nr:hypothetical protein BDZ89DRAFT_1079555 [Hymenopellis radicata]